MAAAAILVVGGGIGGWHRLSVRPAATFAMREIMTRRGERLELGLPDGSREKV